MNPEFLEVMRRDVRFGIVTDKVMGQRRVICRTCRAQQFSQWGPSPTGNHFGNCAHFTTARARRPEWWKAPFVGDLKYVQDPSSFQEGDA